MEFDFMAIQRKLDGKKEQLGPNIKTENIWLAAVGIYHCVYKKKAVLNQTANIKKVRQVLAHL